MGVLQAMLMAGSASAPPPINLSASARVGPGSSTPNVAGPFGNTLQLSPQVLMICEASGGTPPYSYQWVRQNGVNKVSLSSSSGYQVYVGWGDMIVGEYQSVTANCTVTDSAGHSVTTNTVVIAITRVS